MANSVTRSNTTEDFQKRSSAGNSTAKATTKSPFHRNNSHHDMSSPDLAQRQLPNQQHKPLQRSFSLNQDNLSEQFSKAVSINDDLEQPKTTSKPTEHVANQAQPALDQQHGYYNYQQPAYMNSMPSPYASGMAMDPYSFQMPSPYLGAMMPTSNDAYNQQSAQPQFMPSSYDSMGYMTNMNMNMMSSPYAATNSVLNSILTPMQQAYAAPQVPPSPFMGFSMYSPAMMPSTMIPPNSNNRSFLPEPINLPGRDSNVNVMMQKPLVNTLRGGDPPVGYSNPAKSHGEMMLEELRAKMKSAPTMSANNSIGNIYADMGIMWSLPDIKGFVHEFARDQFGSRFIQYKLQDPTVPQSEKDELFTELSAYIQPLCKDVFGNYVVQKLLDVNVGTKAQHNAIYRKAVKHHMYELSTHMYGCRVIQKLIEQVFGFTAQRYMSGNIARDIYEEDDVYNMAMQDPLLAELRQDVVSLVTDQNGNHVIQKCIEQIRPIERLDFFFDAFKGGYNKMSRHPYGCRVVQRVLENATFPIVQDVIGEVMGNVDAMILDQYANYVVQHIVEHTRERDEKEIGMYRRMLFEVVERNLLSFSQHKFGSNVVECCLKFGLPNERERLIDRMLDANTLINMMKDPYANYVVQKVIDKANDRQVQKVIQVVNQNEPSLRRLTYGKHIINKLKSLH